mgnify:CR=1 FL=1
MTFVSTKALSLMKRLTRRIPPALRSEGLRGNALKISYRPFSPSAFVARPYHTPAVRLAAETRPDPYWTAPEEAMRAPQGPRTIRAGEDFERIYRFLDDHYRHTYDNGAWLPEI